MKQSFLILLSLMFLTSCQTRKEPMKEKSELQKMIDQFARTEIDVKMDHLSAKEKEMVKLLVKAGQYADEIFWVQTAYDAIRTRDKAVALHVNDGHMAFAYDLLIGSYDQASNP